MESKIYTYENEEVEVSWDKFRCIHAKECVHGLPEVFDITKKPWINPSEANSIADLKRVIEACPTGALHYTVKNSSEAETPTEKNTLTIIKDGPLYAQGKIHIVDSENDTLFEDTRVAFCRCGMSSNKPFCDNSHIEAGFEADCSYNPERLELEPSTGSGGGVLTIKLKPNGSILVDGDYILNGEEQTTATKKRMSFCRCGASSNKPFCDGTHKSIDFIT